MKVIQVFFRRHLRAMLAAVAVFILLNVLLVSFVAHYTSRGDNYPRLELSEFSAYITEHWDSEEGERAIAARLESVNAWTMLLNQNGEIAWSSRLPDMLNHAYSLVEVAKFSRWYLDEYPVFVWEWTDPVGLLVLGYPSSSVQRYSYTVGPGYYPNLVTGVVIAIMANIIFLVLLLMRNNRRIEAAVRPILSGVETLAAGKSVHLAEVGELADINAGLNLAGDIIMKRDHARAEWINSISHDIRTPLVMIMGYAAEMEIDDTLPAVAKEQAGIIRMQSEKIRKLIDDLNLTSRLEYSMQPVNSTPLCPAELARRAVSEILNSGRDQGYQFEINISKEAENMMVNGDESLLLRLFNNAIGNSMQHNPEGCDIRIDVTQEAECCVITIQDTGIGLQEEMIQHINDEVDIDGDMVLHSNNPHGYGLKIMRQITKAHKGSITYHNIEPHGLSVAIKLPANTSLYESYSFVCSNF